MKLHQNSRLIHFKKYLNTNYNIENLLWVNILDDTWLNEYVPTTLSNGLNIKWTSFLRNNKGELKFDYGETSSPPNKYVKLETQSGILDPIKVIKALDDNDKIELKTEYEKREIPYWKIYDYIDNSWGQEQTSPIFIDWNTGVNQKFFKKKTIVKGDVALEEYYSDYDLETKEFSNLIVCERHEHIYDENGYEEYVDIHIEWHLNTGEARGLKTLKDVCFRKTQKEEKARKRRAYIMDELRAEVRGLPIESFVFEFYKDKSTEIRNYIDTGDRTFYDTVKNDNTQFWLNLDYLPGVSFRYALLDYINIHNYEEE